MTKMMLVASLQRPEPLRQVFDHTVGSIQHPIYRLRLMLHLLSLGFVLVDFHETSFVVLEFSLTLSSATNTDCSV